MFLAGIDIGSRALKAVLTKACNGSIVSKAVIDQRQDQKKAIDLLLRKLLAGCGVKRKDVARIVATGYGRNLVSFADQTVTEITCQAVGVRRVEPDVRTIIDIGGQDTKIIFLDSTGFVRDFVTNDRCAAGTGRFLELLAERLNVPLNTLGNLVRKSRSPAAINSTCAVFAETEIIGLLAAGTRKNDIAVGVQKSIAGRIGAMLSRNIEPPLCFTGGVALNASMASALACALGQDVTVARYPQFTCALGAAIIANQEFDNQTIT